MSCIAQLILGFEVDDDFVDRQEDKEVPNQRGWSVVRFFIWIKFIYIPEKTCMYSITVVASIFFCCVDLFASREDFILIRSINNSDR